jgi:hypothetical protein
MDSQDVFRKRDQLRRLHDDVVRFAASTLDGLAISEKQLAGRQTMNAIAWEAQAENLRQYVTEACVVCGCQVCFDGRDSRKLSHPGAGCDAYEELIAEPAAAETS